MIDTEFAGQRLEVDGLAVVAAYNVTNDGQMQAIRYRGADGADLGW